MLFEKSLLGEQSIEGLQIKYYLIQNCTSFGIGIEEERENTIQCHYEYFTEYKNEAHTLGQQMHQGIVTGVTMQEVIDDYVQ